MKMENNFPSLSRMSKYPSPYELQFFYTFASLVVRITFCHIFVLYIMLHIDINILSI